MATLLHILLAVFCACECVLALRDLRGRFGKLIMFLMLGLTHGVAPAIAGPALLAGSLSERSRLHAAALALVGVILFSLGWRLFDAVRPRFRGLSVRLLDAMEHPQGQMLLRRMFWVCAIVGVLAWAAGIVLSGVGLIEYFRAGRFAFRTTRNIYLGTIASHFISPSALPGLVCFFLPRRYRLLGIAYSVGMAVLLFWGSKGGRAVPLGLLGCLVMGYTLRHRVAIARFLLISAAGLGLMFLSISLYNVRKVMSYRSVGEVMGIIFSAETYRDPFLQDPFNYHHFLVAAVEYFPEQHSFLNGATYRRLFVFFLPRAYFPSVKPEDTNKVFARVVARASGRSATTIPPTMMGDGYVNFWGWPGIAIMLVNGLGFGYVTYKVRSSLPWFLAIGPPYVRLAILSIRGQPYENITIMISSLVLTWLFVRLCGFSFRDLHHMGSGRRADEAPGPGLPPS